MRTNPPGSSISADDTTLEDELCAVEAIFGDDCDASFTDRNCTVYVPSKSTQPNVQLVLFFPLNYPQDAPCVEILAPQLSDDQIQSLTQEMEDIFLPGEVGACPYRTDL